MIFDKKGKDASDHFKEGFPNHKPGYDYEMFNCGFLAGLNANNDCECLPFQSCEKCSEPKTEWLPIPKEIPRDKDYWWLDVNNKTAVGKVLKSGSFSFLGSHIKNGFNWNLVKMFAEIKPPQVTGS